MIAEVIVDVLSSEVDKVFDYIIPSSLCESLTPGYRVQVPFGNRKIEGYVVNIKDSSDYPQEKLKPILCMMDEYPLIKPEIIKLIHYMKDSLYLRLLDGIRLSVPTQVRSKVRDKVERIITLDEDKSIEYLAHLSARNKNAPRLIEYLRNNGTASFTYLSQKFTSAVVKKLLDVGVCKESKKRINRLKHTVRADKAVTLTDLQNEAMGKILQSTDKPIVLYGVTGSGKTEVYMNVIGEILKANQTALMLVPEISLTPQMVSVFTARFGSLVAVLHSALSDGEKHDEWMRIYRGEARIVVGARSAIFAPLEDIGVIIIDEEHDSSYVSESNPRYFTQDIAKFRAKYNSCPLVLGSATPSIETFYKTTTGEYNLASMPIRVNNKPMPPIEIVDMCTEFKLGNTTPISSHLMEKLDKTIQDGNQAILFLNRRGFSSYLMCRECSYIPKCTDCDSNLVYHKNEGLLKCHFCGKRFKALTKCPNCGSDSIKMGATGTQQIVEFLGEKFPDVRVFRLDNDSVTSKDAYSRILGEFAETRPAVLVGTQMVTKGHDFPAISLVGILDADISLFNYSYRASETTFELMTQVAGRAGRDKINGEVVLQTYVPKNPVYLTCANYDYSKFYDKEINLRKTTQFPPFASIVRVLVTSIEDEVAKKTTHDIIMQLKEYRVKYGKDFIFMEAMKSPVGKIKNRHRYQIVMRFTNAIFDNVLKEIYTVLDEKKNNKTSIFVEINPTSLS